jgi:transcriptional regulator with PAS, ATPase and Fis domain
MIETIKNKIGDLLKAKEISLAMIFSKEGEILWQTGRSINGNHVLRGDGFSKSLIRSVLQNKTMLLQENCFACYNELLPESAKTLRINSVLIIPCDQYYLYADSGTKAYFSESEIGGLKTIGQLLSKSISHIRQQSADIGKLIGESHQIQTIREQIIKYAILDKTVLITGETGVGKSQIAELIHLYSGRKGPFVTVHTPSIPESLFESELFGHKKGAFTDARDNKQGLATEAEGGTLFFDEISEVPLTFQTKLLRFIDNRHYHILGDHLEKKADIRIIAATNQNLSELIKNKEFREDLYYRLQVLEIEIPPLRQRKEDIKPIALSYQSLLNDKIPGNGFFDALCQYDWPGNVRELINMLTKAGIHCSNPISGQDIANLINKHNHKLSVPADTHNQKIYQIFNELKSGKNFWEIVREPYLKHDLNRDQVKQIIQLGMSQTKADTYSSLLELFHLKRSEYKKFMNFLFANDLK